MVPTTAIVGRGGMAKIFAEICKRMFWILENFTFYTFSKS